MAAIRPVQIIKDDSKSTKILNVSSEKKLEIALKDALSNPRGWDSLWKGNLAYATNILIKSQDAKVKGDKLKGKYDNNYYSARGEFTLNVIEQKTGDLKHGKRCSYSIDFRDSLDENGIPDLFIEKFQVSTI